MPSPGPNHLRDPLGGAQASGETQKPAGGEEAQYCHPAGQGRDSGALHPGLATPLLRVVPGSRAVSGTKLQGGGLCKGQP